MLWIFIGLGRKPKNLKDLRDFNDLENVGNANGDG